MAWPGERYLTKEEREKIKAAKEREKLFYQHVASAVERMTPKPTTYKLKDYKNV